MSPSSQSSSPRRLNRRALIGLLIVAIPSIILLMPALYYGSFTLQIARIVFDETTNPSQPSLSYSGSDGKAEPHNIYDYVFNIETVGILRTRDTSVSTSQGTVTLTINVTVTTYTGKTVYSYSTILNGGMGRRSHALYLGPSQGVHPSQVYSASITLTANISPSNTPAFTNSTTIPAIAFAVPAY